MRHKVSGFSLIELLLAGALFSLFVIGVAEVLLRSLETDRLGEETTIATQYASEGLEALRSLRAKNFDDLVETAATGLAEEDGRWVLSGTEDTWEKYTRVVSIAPVFRDENGHIDERGGTIDPDTRKVVVTVSFRVAPRRSNSVVLETFLTRWK